MYAIGNHAEKHGGLAAWKGYAHMFSIQLPLLTTFVEYHSFLGA